MNRSTSVQDWDSKKYPLQQKNDGFSLQTRAITAQIAL